MRLPKSTNIETQALTIGFMPLTDCAPIVMAKELGIFKAHGLDVTLEKQFSWATMRDKLHAGLIDAGQLLAPMPLASSLGLGGFEPISVIAPMVLSRNGNAITLSESLYQDLMTSNQLDSIDLPVSSSLLQPIIDKRKSVNKKLTFGTVFLYSCHYYQLLSWLESNNIEASDIEIIIVPPSKMVESLKSGVIDGFCVGGPYNAKAVREGVGFTGVTSPDIWPNVPEKVLGLLQSWYVDNPNTTYALIAALKKTCDWLSSSANRFEAARVLSQRNYLDVELDIIAPSMLESCLVHSTVEPRAVLSYNQFSLSQVPTVNSPEHYYGEWLLNAMKRAGQLGEGINTSQMTRQVFRQDIFKTALL